MVLHIYELINEKFSVKVQKKCTYIYIYKTIKRFLCYLNGGTELNYKLDWTSKRMT